MRRHFLLHLKRNQADSLAQAGEATEYTEYTEELVKQEQGYFCPRKISTLGGDRNVPAPVTKR